MNIATHCVCCGGTDLITSPAILVPFMADRIFGWKPVEVVPEWGLRTIPCGKMHTPCNSFRCCACGLLFLDMRFSDDELAKLYHDYNGTVYGNLRELYEGSSWRAAFITSGSSEEYFRSMTALIAPYIPQRPTILDWGGGTGLNTPFRDRNTLLHLLDVTEQKLVPGATWVANEAALLPRYDLIVCSHLLEHVSFPMTVLEKIKAHADNDTAIFIELPYEQSMYANLPKHYWHEHINFFTEKALYSLLKCAGLQVLEFYDCKSDYLKRVRFFRIVCKLMHADKVVK